MENLHPLQFRSIESNVSAQNVTHLKRNYLKGGEKYLASLSSLSYSCALFNFP